jgi:hypothetical protein
MYRRKIVEGLSPGQPDRRHMHQLIYEYLTKRDSKEATDPESMIRRNSRVAPFSWLMSLCCVIVAIFLWKETPWLIAASLLFCAIYVSLYRWLLLLLTRGG